MPPVGHSPGGSARVGSPTYDFVAPTSIALATALSEDRQVLYDRGLPILLSAQDFEVIDELSSPPAAMYEVFAMYAITFE